MKSPESFLPEKYPDLPGSKPVERAVRSKLHQGEKGPQTKEKRVGAYLERIEKIVARGNKVSDERGWELLKNKIIKEFAIDTNDSETLAKIAHGLYESEKKLDIEQGRGADIAQLERESGLMDKYQELVKEKRDIQERTLANWLDYLKQNDAEYPTWFRYFVVRNLQKMGTVDKEQGEYTKRTPLTVAPFPELNSEALGFVYRVLVEGIGKDEFTKEEDLAKKQKLGNLIAKKDFAKLYTFAQIETAGKLNKESIEGQWMKYNQKSDHRILENALRGKGTGWCTAEGSAHAHLEGGDFYVYYTKGADGAFTEPRIAIRMENDQVAEVRGVNHRQELEPALVDVAQERYHSLPGGEKFDKASADMKKMTELAKKQEQGELLTKGDLTFLYEINSPIEYFGYQPDPRIAELRQQRNPEADMLIIFECTQDQIAHSAEEINENTKAFVGELKTGIFDKIQKYNLEHIYTRFPEGKIRFEDLEIGGRDFGGFLKELKDKKINIGGDLTHQRARSIIAEIQKKKVKISEAAKQFLEELVKKSGNIGDYAQDLFKSDDFETIKNSEEIKLVRLKVRDLGFPNGATTDEIYQKAKKLGLELCPAEVGPSYRLKYTSQPLNEWIWIAMKQIAGRGGSPGVFELVRAAGGLWLSDDWAGPGRRWGADDKFVFRLRKFAA